MRDEHAWFLESVCAGLRGGPSSIKVHASQKRALPSMRSRQSSESCRRGVIGRRLPGSLSFIILWSASVADEVGADVSCPWEWWLPGCRSLGRICISMRQPVYELKVMWLTRLILAFALAALLLRTLVDPTVAR